MVPGVNLTLEDASNSAASEREIQSDGGFDIGQSGSFTAGVALDDAPPRLADDSAPASEPAPGSPGDSRVGLPVIDRSFRAQPLPLKWTAGTAKAFFIGPPQSGQVDGPWPKTECTTSIEWPQLVQM